MSSSNNDLIIKDAWDSSDNEDINTIVLNEDINTIVLNEDNKSISSLPLNKIPCRFYSNGHCFHGKNCKYNHDIEIQNKQLKILLNKLKKENIQLKDENKCLKIKIDTLNNYILPSLSYDKKYEGYTYY